jgi:hypothetical protein
MCHHSSHRCGDSSKKMGEQAARNITCSYLTTLGRLGKNSQRCLWQALHSKSLVICCALFHFAQNILPPFGKNLHVLATEKLPWLLPFPK